MILGLGTDIVEVERIRYSLERFGDTFLNRILLPQEREYCLAHPDPAPHVAVRFSAKEAISKAFGTGIGEELGWHDMEVARKPSGEPYVILHGKGQALLRTKGGTCVLLSLSHTRQYATATAIVA